jgi:methylated-DNA-protein-cysteine methyltransferase-like protein
MSKFKESIYKVVRLIPEGKVASYGQVALYVGIPRGARQVGWMLNQSKEGDIVPWWRVVNNTGRVSVKGFRCSASEQAELLRQEGLKISNDLTFDIKKYRFKPDNDFINKLELDPEYLALISDKIQFSDGYFGKKK